MKHWRNREFLIATGVGLLLLMITLVINFYAGIYATESASNSVTDVVLSNIRVFDVDGLFIYGTFIFWVVVALIVFLNVERLPFSLKSIALFVLVRSVFISLTHIGPYPTQLIIHSTVLSKFASGGDLFFSGHTGLPFLFALIFWDKPLLRAIFVISSVAFGLVVLLAHLHYSIDVLAAFFITYTIYHLAEVIFRHDRERFADKS